MTSSYIGFLLIGLGKKNKLGLSKEIFLFVYLPLARGGLLSLGALLLDTKGCTYCKAVVAIQGGLVYELLLRSII